MRVEPEQVLPEQNLAAPRRVEEVRPERPVEQEHPEGRGQDWRRHELQDGGDEQRPHRQRHSEEMHPGSAHVHDRGDVVHRPHDRRRPEDEHTHDPEGLAQTDAGVLRVGAQWRVSRPAGGRGSTLDEERRSHDGAARQRHPERQHVQLVKRHVPGSDHQRNQEIPEGAGQDRDDHQEDHDRSVHGEQGVVVRRVCRIPALRKPRRQRDLPIGEAELPADNHRQESAQDHEQQAHEQELNPDDLVVLGEDVFRDEGLLVVSVVLIGHLRATSGVPDDARYAGGASAGATFAS